MALCLSLIPSLDPNETLLPGISERPEISLRSDDKCPSLTLGRGSLTGIIDNSIGESVVSLSFDEKSIAKKNVRVTLVRDSDKCRVHVNGASWERSLQKVFHLSSGDLLSLDGLRYEYRIQITTMSTTQKKPPMGSVSKTQSQPEDEAISISSILSSSQEQPPLSGEATDDSIALSAATANRLSEEVLCSVCLDIHVHPRTLNPCGHTFCSPCLEKLENCPQCRKEIESHVPARELENLITTLATIPNLLEPDDVQQYNERKKTTPRIHCATTRSAKRVRRDRAAQYHAAVPRSSGPLLPTHTALDPSFPPPFFPNYAQGWTNATISSSLASVGARSGNYVLFAPSGNNSAPRRDGFNARAPPPAPQASQQPGGASASEAICID